MYSAVTRHCNYVYICISFKQKSWTQLCISQVYVQTQILLMVVITETLPDVCVECHVQWSLQSCWSAKSGQTVNVSNVTAIFRLSASTAWCFLGRSHRNEVAVPLILTLTMHLHYHPSLCILTITHHNAYSLSPLTTHTHYDPSLPPLTMNPHYHPSQCTLTITPPPFCTLLHAPLRLHCNMWYHVSTAAHWNMTVWSSWLVTQPQVCPQCTLLHTYTHTYKLSTFHQPTQ